jgi:hypothetical protein
MVERDWQRKAVLLTAAKKQRERDEKVDRNKIYLQRHSPCGHFLQITPTS